MKLIPREILGQWRPIELIWRARYVYEQDPSPENRQALQETLERYDTENASPFRRLRGQSQYDEDLFFQDGYSLALLSHPRYLPPNWHAHDFYELVYVYRGGCENLLEEAALQMRAGDFCILPPNLRHCICCCRDDGLILNILIRKSTFRQSFRPLLSDLGLLSSFFSGTLFQKENSGYLLFRCGEDPVISRLVLDMHREYVEQDAFSRSLLSGQLMELLALLMRRHQLDAIRMTGRDRTQPAHIAQMLQYIEDHIADVTLHEIAQAFSYSDGHCSAIIKDATGKHFSELLRTGKAQRAAALLRETGKSLTAIAQEAGFCDSSHMSRVFSAVYGQTPARYRKEFAAQGEGSARE